MDFSMTDIYSVYEIEYSEIVNLKNSRGYINEDSIIANLVSFPDVPLLCQDNTRLRRVKKRKVGFHGFHKVSGCSLYRNE